MINDTSLLKPGVMVEHENSFTYLILDKNRMRNLKTKQEFSDGVRHIISFKDLYTIVGQKTPKNLLLIAKT